MLNIESQVERVKAVFDEWAQNGRAEGMERGHGPTAIQAFERLPLGAGARYLDIGCGNGYTVRWALERSEISEAWGIDVAPQMIELARTMTAGKSEQELARFFSGVFPSAELPNNYFDAVFSMEVFYYMPSVDDGLAGVHALLRPGGHFACVVDYYQENSASHSWPDDTGVAMTLWSADEWHAAFERAGLEVVEQARLRPARDVKADEWKHAEGSLMTLGKKR